MTTLRKERIAKRKALQAWSRLIRVDGECAVCQRTDHLQAHHLLFKERYPEYSLEPMNGLCLCPKCHRFGKYSFHKNPMWSMVWLRDNRPVQYEWLTKHV